MLAKTVTFDLTFILLVAAIAAFVLAAGAVKQWAKGWLIPLGLACFAAAVLVQWKL